MGYLPIDYVQLQRSVSCSDSRCLKLVREIKVSNFSDFCNSFQSLAAENWKERRPNEVLALGMISEMHLLECMLRVCVGLEPGVVGGVERSVCALISFIDDTCTFTVNNVHTVCIL